MEDVDALLDQVGHGELVGAKDLAHLFLVVAAEAVALSLTHLLVVVERNRIVATQEGLVGLHELLENWLAAIHIYFYINNYYNEK